eukprot:CAMPEP_0197832304 /NCGR_PEP_ID=MMETSP1437-20131217/14183_1 /TAXON_ID=49252 ORGANISM="Eucampia antarctica, Strain CCMP1452" /NCGR_SAMPLE_ID=MMETSP1437 /ASSEMBLY_ACC=CAM_ASM_001096 /LENGTH=356 /DNA_ID=CAMNT_0043435613 /DNA_START=121 /DNA_END=1191 /DNA_ORIENTATION=-
MQQQQEQQKDGVAATKCNSADEDDDSSYYSSEEDDDLVLEGVLRRNQDVPSSSDDDDSDDSSSDEEEVEPTKKKARVAETSNKNSTASKNNKKQESKQNKKSKKKNGDKKSKNEPEIIQVDFNFCDMDEKYFHGIKTHLLTEAMYAPFSSGLADMMVENVSVGTVISCDDGQDNVFGLASVLRVMSGEEGDCIKAIKESCMNHCPKQHKKEMDIVLSGKTKRPAGFLIHSRMVNLPLEITLILHQQLVLDMDWAVQHAEGGEKERKSLDFGAFILLAPCTHGTDDGSSLIYKKFDDEVFSTHAEYVFTFDAPKRLADQDKPEKQLVTAIVLTKTGHRAALKELEQMIGTGTGTTVL